MSRNPFNSPLYWQTLNLTHCWRINREAERCLEGYLAGSASLWGLEGHWKEVGGSAQSYHLQSHMLSSTHTHTVRTYTQHVQQVIKVLTLEHLSFSLVFQSLLPGDLYLQRIQPRPAFSLVRCWNHPVQQQAEMSRGHWGLVCSWWIISHLVPLKATNNGLNKGLGLFQRKKEGCQILWTWKIVCFCCSWSWSRQRCSNWCSTSQTKIPLK